MIDERTDEMDPAFHSKNVQAKRFEAGRLPIKSAPRYGTVDPQFDDSAPVRRDAARLRNASIFDRMVKNARILGLKISAATVVAHVSDSNLATAMVAAPISDYKTATAMVAAPISDYKTATAMVAARISDYKTATATVVARISDYKMTTATVVAAILDYKMGRATVAASVSKPKTRMFLKPACANFPLRNTRGTSISSLRTSVSLFSL